MFWPNGDEALCKLKANPPLSFGNSCLPFKSMPAPRVGLSSIITSESSFLGGVTCRWFVGVPKAKGLLPVAAPAPFVELPNSAEPVGVDGVPEPNANGLFSAVGVAGAAPNWNGDLVGVGADGVDG